MPLKIQTNSYKITAVFLALATLIVMAECMKRTQYHEQVSC